MKLNKVLSQIRGYSMDSKGGNFSEPTNIEVEIASLDLLKKIFRMFCYYDYNMISLQGNVMRNA